MTDQLRSRHPRVVAGREVFFDSEGFFWDPDDWTEAGAVELARESGIEQLEASQWQVIRFLRSYFAMQGRTPMNRELKAGTGMSLIDLEGLFPGGIKHGARRLAGLPNPKTCLD